MTKLVVGLGNPGPKYAKTRHNVGFMALECLRERLGLPEFREKFSGVFTKGTVRGEDVALLEPLTYMNDSGRSVQAAAAFFHVSASASELLVLHDELDIVFADVRLKAGGGHAGHNGLRSIIGLLGADFARVRVGIGRPPPEFRGEIADYVLSSFDPAETAGLGALITRAAASAELWIEQGAPAAMNRVNERSKKV